MSEFEMALSSSACRSASVAADEMLCTRLSMPASSATDSAPGGKGSASKSMMSCPSSGISKSSPFSSLSVPRGGAFFLRSSFDSHVQNSSVSNWPLSSRS